MIHCVTSRNSYHFNYAWLLRPPPDAPDAPVPDPPAPPIPAGVWFAHRADWAMHSPTAKRTIRALTNTTVSTRQPMAACTTPSCDSEADASIQVEAGWSYVLLAPPVGVGPRNETWELKCPCTRLA
jgi:hypothetical protein